LSNDLNGNNKTIENKNNENKNIENIINDGTENLNLDNKLITTSLELFAQRITEILEEHYYTNIFVIDLLKDDLNKILDILKNDKPKFTFIVSPFITKSFIKLKSECNKQEDNCVSYEIVDYTVRFVPKEMIKVKNDDVKVILSNGDAKKEFEFKCTTCIGAVFKDKDTFREHYKSEWHTKNVKRKSKNLDCVD